MPLCCLKLVWPYENYCCEDCGGVIFGGCEINGDEMLARLRWDANV